MNRERLKQRLLDFGVDGIAISNILIRHKDDKDLERLIDYFEPRAMKAGHPPSYLAGCLQKETDPEKVIGKLDKVQKFDGWSVPYLSFQLIARSFFEDLGGAVCFYFHRIWGIDYEGIEVIKILERHAGEKEEDGTVYLFLGGGERIRWRNVDKRKFTCNLRRVRACGPNCTCVTPESEEEEALACYVDTF